MISRLDVLRSDSVELDRAETEELLKSAEPSAWRKLFSSWPAASGAVIVILIIVIALTAPWISPADPLEQNITNRLRPPVWMPGGSPENILGTDSLGRDLLSRIIYGSRISLIVGICAVAVSGGIGVFLGLISGYYGGVMDTLLGRLADTQMGIPFLVLAVAVVAVVGSSLFNLIVVLAVTTWVLYYRVVRGEVLSVRENGYVDAARAVGAGNGRIIRMHILPNVTASIIVVSTLLVANMIIFEASLSFLGLGVPPPTPTWGRMVADGRQYIATAWWISFFPGMAILVTVMGINLLGDKLREILDPRQREL